MRRSDTRRRPSLVPALAIAIGCGPTLEPAGTTEGSSGGTTDASASGAGEETADAPEAPPPSSVSVLLVVDDSASMAEEQAALTAAIGGLTDALSAAGVPWRLGITTTDNGNPWCQGTTPAGGRLVASSCRARLLDFVGDGFEPDPTPLCVPTCPEAWAQIDLAPVAIEGTATPTVKPWIQDVGGETNLPPGLSMADALGCLVPQGIRGCGFEEPLDTMRNAIVRARTDGEAQKGFVPEGAMLAVVVVTDEIDCSVHDDHEAIFAADGDRVFWSNPADDQPTSAVCWNAGVSCTGGTCISASFDEQGDPVDATTHPGDAVVLPVARYLDVLGERPGTSFLLIGGVATDGSVTYAPGDDPAYQEEFGIGPGCESATGRGVPPVRMREVAEAFPVDGGQAMYSICDADYAPAMDALAASILARVQP